MNIIDKGLVYRIYRDRETPHINKNKTKQPIWKLAELEFTENYFLYVQRGMYKTCNLMSVTKNE